MTKPRQVKRTAKDNDGDITHLVGDFGRVPISQAAREIESGRQSYSSGRSAIGVVKAGGRKHLRTAPDGKQRNNLDNLPDA